MLSRHHSLNSPYPAPHLCLLALLCLSWLPASLLAQGNSGEGSATDDERVDFYRVELITFRHLGTDVVPQLGARVTDFSDIAEAGLLLPAGLDAEDPALQQLPSLEERSRAMDQAWRRLEGSARYQPEAYVSWLQPPLDRSRRRGVRVHGEALLAEPVMAPPTDIDGEQDLPEVYDVALSQPEPAETEAVAEEDLFETLDANLPNYAMDGKASLTDGRFLQLWLELEWRQPADFERIDHPDLDELHYAVYPLLQQRVVEVGKMYYFDSPALAVLARIESIQLAQDEAELAGEPPAERAGSSTGAGSDPGQP